MIPIPCLPKKNDHRVETEISHDDLLAQVDSNGIDHDGNGNMVASITAEMEYNWKNNLRSGEAGDDSMAVKYDRIDNQI